MADLFDRRDVTLAQQLAAVEREIIQRKRVYPRLVSIGKMRQQTADHEIAAMKAVAVTVQAAIEDESRRALRSDD